MPDLLLSRARTKCGGKVGRLLPPLHPTALGGQRNQGGRKPPEVLPRSPLHRHRLPRVRRCDAPRLCKVDPTPADNKHSRTTDGDDGCLPAFRSTVSCRARGGLFATLLRSPACPHMPNKFFCRACSSG